MNKINPDDYYNNGLFEMVRFGEKIIIKNNMSFFNTSKQLIGYLKTEYDNVNVVIYLLKIFNSYNYVLN